MMTNAATLDGVRAKLNRAWEHFEALKAEIEASNVNPQTVHIEERNDGEVVISAPVPSYEYAAIIFGDFIHNLRSTLDHLVWQLVILDGLQEPGWHTSFPIEDSCQRFIQLAVQGSRRKKPFLHGLDVTGRSFAIVEKAQPYHRPEPERSALRFLRRVSNVDKHQTVPVKVTFPTNPEAVQQQIQWNPDAIIQTEEYPVGQALEDDAVIARLRFDPTGPAPEVHVKGNISFTPGFADRPEPWPDGTVWASIGLLTDLYETVRGIVDEAAELFNGIAH